MSDFGVVILTVVLTLQSVGILILLSRTKGDDGFSQALLSFLGNKED